jgi:SP family xylose:H+ symportor-like MFS transporter
MMDENEFLIAKFNHGFPFFLYGAMCVVLIAFTWRFIPETKGRSLEEIENMWIKK